METPQIKRPGVCSACGSRLKRNGTTKAGTTRWRCTGCGASSTKRRPDLVRRSQLERFVAWLLGKSTQGESAAQARSFRRLHAWCWNVIPAVRPTGVVHDEIQLDGLYLRGGWCVLVAIADMKVVDWQWCNRENAAAWGALLERIPPPRVVLVDGGSGLAKALKMVWPQVHVQRCLLHVKRVVLSNISRNSRTTAGRSLRVIASELTQVRTIKQATDWIGRLHEWHQVFEVFINEKTIAGPGVVRPEWAPSGKEWWWTHKKARSAYTGLEARVRAGDLFTFLDPKFDGLNISSTTNRIEGGINAQLRLVLRHHRGMSIHHRRRAIDWWCYTHAEFPVPLTELARPEQWQPREKPTVIDAETPGSWGTEATAEEGLHARQGWAGRPASGFTTRRSTNNHHDD